MSIFSGSFLNLVKAPIVEGQGTSEADGTIAFSTILEKIVVAKNGTWQSSESYEGITFPLVKTININFGSTGKFSDTYDFNDPDVVTSNTINVWSVIDDENTSVLDPVVVSAYVPVDGIVRVSVNAVNGKTVGVRRFAYTVFGSSSVGAVSVFTPEMFWQLGETTWDAAINTALTAAGTGGIVQLKNKDYPIASTISLNEARSLVGVSASSTFGDQLDQGSSLKWVGAAGGLMVYISSPDATMNSGGTLGPITINCNNIAAYGIVSRNTDNWFWDRVRVVYPDPSSTSSWAVLCDSGSTVGGGVAGCNYGHRIEQLMVHVAGVANGLRLSGATGVNGSNCTFMDFSRIHVTHEDGTAVLIDKADDVHIRNLGISRAVGGTGDALVLDGRSDWVIGNTIWGIQSSISDGPAPKIRLRGEKCRHNQIHNISGVDHVPVISFEDSCLTQPYSFMGTGYETGGQTPEQAGGFSVIHPPKIIARPLSTDSEMLNAFTNVKPFTLYALINGNILSGQSVTAKWFRAGNLVTINVVANIGSKGAFTGAVAFYWDSNTAGNPPGQLSGFETFSIARPYSGFVSGVIDRPIGVSLSSSSISLLKTVSGATSMVVCTDADVSSNAIIHFSLTFPVLSA